MSILENTKISKSDEKNTIGVSPKIMGFVNGQKVMVKSTDGEPQEALAEYFAYQLGTRIGLNVNQVEIIDCGDKLDPQLDPICTVHWWEDEFIIYRKYQDEESVYDKALRKFFDVLLDNDDRHGSNFGFLNDEIFFIDHGCCYPWEPFLTSDREKLCKYAKEIPDVVSDFMKLTDEDFYEMLDIEVYDFGIVKYKHIIRRMMAAQNALKEEGICH